MERHLTEDDGTAGRKKRKADEVETAPLAKRFRPEAGGQDDGDAAIKRQRLDVIRKIASGLISGNPLATKNDLTSFSLVSREFREAVENEIINGEVRGGSPALAVFNHRLRRLGNLAVKTMRDVVPEEGLPDELSSGVPRDDRRDEPIAAHDFVDVAGRLLPFQKEEVAERFVDSALAFEVGESVATGEVLHALAKHSDALSAKDRERLSRRSLEELIASDGLTVVDHEIARALANLESKGHLSGDFKKDMGKTLAKNTDLNELAEQVMEEVRGAKEEESSAVVDASEGLAEDSLSLDDCIKALEDKSKSKSNNDGKPDRDISPHQRLDLHEEMATKIPILYRRSRVEFLRSMRDDDRGR